MRKIVLIMLLGLSLDGMGQTGFLSLAGNWAFKIDSSNIGGQEEWYKKSIVFFDRQIKLPGTMDDAGFGNRVTIQPELKREVLLHLWRKVSYIGVAWYQKEVEIPANWNNKEVKLFLERVIWKTNIWVDGKPVNEFGESLVTPHEFNLTNFLKPGRHIITMQIDNSRRYDISLGTANFAHAYTDETQIIWNGVIGKIALTATDKIYFDNVQVFPDPEHRSMKIVSYVYNALDENVNSKVVLTALMGINKCAEYDTSMVLKPGFNEINSTINITGVINKWDEFNPQLYQLKASLKTAIGNYNSTISFGFRTISNANAQLKINDRLLFLRGTLECSIFPKEGHAPMEKAGWIRVFNIAKSYGLNHLRFHSWCPPEAAFEAADETGFYLQIELPVWTLKIGKDAAADEFLKAEANRMIKYYGNHPSFCFWSMGNEMQGDMQWLANEVTFLKAKDNRRLYTTTTFTFEKGFGTSPQPEDDFFVTQYTNKGWVRGQGIFDTEPPTFNKDYNAAVDSLKVPLIIHEVGQYAVFPNMAELPKYTGVLRPVNFMAVQNDLAKKKMLSLAGNYTKASGKLAVLLYKEEIERALKTKGVSGFQLLDLHDFPGQGTALVGILDAFWESKGLIKPEDFRKFCSPVVPLIRFPKATYTNQESFTASIEIANFSGSAIQKPLVKWEILNEKKMVLASGKIPLSKIEVGNGVNIGNINVALNKVATAQKLTVAVSIENTAYTNSWNIWVYPDNDNVTGTGIVFSTDINDAIKVLNAGKSVLLNPAKENINGVEGKFVQVFWSPVHFPNQPGTMGLMIDPAHPAFKYFPTDAYSNWQWWDLCKNSTTLVLDSTGINASAIVLRAIDNFFKNRTMAGIIEVKVGRGKLLFCSMDISTDLANRPVARQLRYSLIQYMKTNQFNPITTLGEADIRKLTKR